MKHFVKNLLGSENSGLTSDAARFVMAGTLNVLIGVVVYQLALFVTGHKLAFVFSWLGGIVYVIIIYPTKVFPGGDSNYIKNIAVIAVYLIVFIISYLSLAAIVEGGMSERLAIFFVLLISTSLNFLCMRILYRFV